MHVAIILLSMMWLSTEIARRLLLVACLWLDKRKVCHGSLSEEGIVLPAQRRPAAMLHSLASVVLTGLLPVHKVGHNISRPNPSIDNHSSSAWRSPSHAVRMPPSLGCVLQPPSPLQALTNIICHPFRVHSCVLIRRHLISILLFSSMFACTFCALIPLNSNPKFTVTSTLGVP